MLLWNYKYPFFKVLIFNIWASPKVTVLNNPYNNKIEVKFVRQISYPPANGASYGNNFLPKSHKLAFHETKWAYKNSSVNQICKLLFLKFHFDPMSNRWDIGSKCCWLGPWPWPYSFCQRCYKIYSDNSVLPFLK